MVSGIKNKIKLLKSNKMIEVKIHLETRIILECKFKDKEDYGFFRDKLKYLDFIEIPSGKIINSDKIILIEVNKEPD